ncbi:hypothetical protein [Sagittula sp. S175]|uniref:hypothetical protein n=1 Tax=Sagittula sp. S175 TaxID=3415129 RepID=UPI003C7DFFBC
MDHELIPVSDPVTEYDTPLGLPPVAPMDMPTQVLERRDTAETGLPSLLQSVFARLLPRHA